MHQNIFELKRIEKKISISKIAKQTNLSYSTVYRILNNIIEKPSINQNLAEKKKIEQNSDTPSLEQIL